MFDKEQFVAAWKHYIEHATITDITSPNFGRLFPIYMKGLNRFNITQNLWKKAGAFSSIVYRQ